MAESLGSMEDRLFWHERLTYVNGTSILRHINRYLGGDASEDKKQMARDAGNLVIEMMGSVADSGRDDYLDLLNIGRPIMTGMISAGLIQAGASDSKPDHELLELASHVGLMGTRLVEAKFDLWNAKDGKPELPEEMVSFMTLDDTFMAYKDMAKKQGRRFSGQGFVDSWNLQKQKFASEPEKVVDIVASNKFSMQRYFEEEFAQIASDALDHLKNGYMKAVDGYKREFYQRNIEVLKGIKDVFLSDDPIYSSKRLFDAETYRFIDKVALPEERQEIELSLGMPFGDLMNELGTPENDREWELDMIQSKFMAYGRALEDVNSLVYDIMKHEMVDGEGDGKPDTYLLYSIDHTKNVVMGIEKIAPGINNSIASLSNVLGLKMVEVTQRFNYTNDREHLPYYTAVQDKLNACTEAREYAVQKLMESVALYDTYGSMLQFYGNNDADGSTVLKRRLDGKTFDDILSMAKEGGKDIAQKIKRYVDGRRGA